GGDGVVYGCPGEAGSLAQGGSAGVGLNCAPGGGGGGSGLYGAGGGGGGGVSTGTAGGGGGGGGSSLLPAGGTFSPDLTGTPEIAISYTAPETVMPAALDFGSQPLGSTSASKTVTLRDTGT